ncbi:hypothetical protein V1477_008349, partial [Vespula maculifrons]
MLLVNERTVVTALPPPTPLLLHHQYYHHYHRHCRASSSLGTRHAISGPKLHGLRIELAHCLLFTTKVLIVSRRVERHYKNAISGQTAVEEEKEEEEEEEDDLN